MKKRDLALFFVVLVGFAFLIGAVLYTRQNPAPNPTTSNPAGKNTINIESGGKYNPAKYTVRAGTGMTWINKDVVDHSVTFDKLEVDSGKMAPQDIFSHLFDQRGSYYYHCSLHPEERGFLKVE